MKLAELMYDAGAQFVALDPVGVWYGPPRRRQGEGAQRSRSSAGCTATFRSSRRRRADRRPDRRSRPLVRARRQPVRARRRQGALRAAFIDRFFFRKKAAPSAVHLFLEECQEFVPQNPQRGEEQMLHDFTRMAKLGRNFGIGISLISQRPQEINKKVAQPDRVPVRLSR
jgi:DNA helicase HerA-like ATPase